MNAAVVQSRTAPPILKDSSLLRDRCLVDGQWVESDNRARIDVDNPADGALVATVPDCGAAETRRAIAAADAALPAWRKLLAKERAAILPKWSHLTVASADALPALLTPHPSNPLA